RVVLGGAGAGLEQGDRAYESVGVPEAGPGAVDVEVHAGVGVVGDCDVAAAAQEGRGRAGALVDLAGLAPGATGVRLLPDEARGTVGRRPHQVQGLIGSDRDALAGGRERVLQIGPGELRHAHGAGARVERAEAAVTAGPPDPALEVGLHADDGVALTDG